MNLIDSKQLASVKKARDVQKVTKEEFEQIVLNIAHAKRDIVWWAEHFFRIVSLNTGLGLIQLYDKQKLLLKHLVANDRSVILSSRQTGKTTTYTIFCMWLATLFPEKKIMICANKLQTAIEIMDRLRIAYEYLPSWIKPGILVYNKGEITFSNQSSIRAFATSSSASRGFSGQCVIIDEMAFIPKNVIDAFFASVIPVVSSAKDSKVIAVSTPNGTSGLYYDIWQQANSKEANNNKEGWKAFRIDWWEVPGRTEEWKEKQIASIGIQKWNQEFGNEFQTSTMIKKLIPTDIIENYRMKLSEYKVQNIKPKKQKIVSQTEDELFEFDMWHEFQPNRTYLASGDISEGVGSDASVLYVWDVTDVSNVVMCAKFSSNTVSLVQFAYICSKILAIYNNPWLFAERNGVSAGMIDSLRVTYGYRNIASENKKNEYGIFSHITTKSKACLWCRDMMTTKGFGFTIYDNELIDEMSIFIRKDTKNSCNVYQAMPGPDSHDDHMMSFIWSCYALQKEIVNKYFIVAGIFTSELGQIYPQTLMPLVEYTAEEVKKINADPLYKQFLDFKEEMNEQLRDAYLKTRNEDRNDIFKYQQFQQRQQDIYFGGYNDEPSWNSPQKQNYNTSRNFYLSPQIETTKPSFFIV